MTRSPGHERPVSASRTIQISNSYFVQARLAVVSAASGRMHRVLLAYCGNNVIGLRAGSIDPFSLSTCTRRLAHQQFRHYASSVKRTHSGRPFSCGTTHGSALASPRAQLGIRRINWKSRSSSSDFGGISDAHEDLTKAAILDKVMKGRQPADLMLRCSSSPCVLLRSLSFRI